MNTKLALLHSLGDELIQVALGIHDGTQMPESFNFMDTLAAISRIPELHARLSAALIEVEQAKARQVTQEERRGML